MDEGKIPFWRKIVISIKDIDKYQDLAVYKTHKTLGYVAILIIILTIAMSTTILLKFNGSFDGFADYISKISLNDTNINTLIESKNQADMQLQGTPQDEIIEYIIWPLSIFIVYFLTILIDSLTLAVMGYFVCVVVKIKLKFRELYNIAIYSFTLPIILNIIYAVINISTGFIIKYFQTMYTVIACIYVISAILIIRSNIIRKNIELNKVLEVQEKVRIELEQKEQEKREQEEKERVRKKDRETQKKEKQKKGNSPEGEPEGTKA